MEELPALALERVLSFLDDADIMAFSGCSRRIRDASLEEAVWKPRCEAYGVGIPGTWAPQLPPSSPAPGPEAVAAGTQESEPGQESEDEASPVAAVAPSQQGYSYRLLYLGLLRRYGQLLADPSAPRSPGALRLWQATDSPFGGLLAARFEPPGAIVLHSVIVYRLNGPVQSRPILRITPKPPPPLSLPRPTHAHLPPATPPPSPLPGPSSSAASTPPAPPPGPQDPPMFPAHLLKGLFTFMRGVIGGRTTPEPAPGLPDQQQQQDPATSQPPPQPQPRPQAKCCCQLPIPASGELELHDATIHLVPPSPPSASSTAEGFAVWCSRGCRHTEFDPLLRHTGGLGAEIDFTSADISESRLLIQQQGQGLGQGLRVPEIVRQKAQLFSLQFVPHHMRFLNRHRAEAAAAAAAVEGGRPPLPGDVPADALLYRAVQVGRGHPLAGLWRGTYNFHGVEILNFVPHTSGPPGGGALDKLLGVKVTGDANVPAGQVSLEVQLCAPHPEPAAPPGRRFALPPHCTTGVELGAVEALVVQSVYVGRGHIAQTGFQQDEWTDVEIVVFEGGHCLGAIWHELGSFSLFSRLPL